MAGFSRPSIKVGKLSSKKASFPTESDYMASMKATSKELEDILLKLMKDVEDISAPLMLDVLSPTFDKSQQYCPIDKGPLRASGYLEVTSFRGNPRVEMGYARGGRPWYAVVVHEDPQFQHKPPTRYKWLQAAMMEDLPSMYTKLGASYKGAIGL